MIGYHPEYYCQALHTSPQVVLLCWLVNNHDGLHWDGDGDISWKDGKP